MVSHLDYCMAAGDNRTRGGDPSNTRQQKETGRVTREIENHATRRTSIYTMTGAKATIKYAIDDDMIRDMVEDDACMIVTVLFFLSLIT
jgi:hypothetical protein